MINEADFPFPLFRVVTTKLEQFGGGPAGRCQIVWAGAFLLSLSHLIRMRNLRGWHFGAQKTSIRLAKANLIPWVFSDYDWLYCTCFQMGLNPFFRFYVVIPSLRRYFCRLILRIGFLSFHWNASCHHGSQIWRRKCIAHKPEIERDFFPWKVRSVTVITRDE